MNAKTLIGLAVVAVVAIAAAILVDHHKRPASDTAQADAYLVPGLRDHLNDLDRIVVRGAGDRTIATLARGKNGWTLAEKGGYAVDTSRVRDFLLKLADARRVEQKTSAKDKYATLGVEDVAVKDAKGVEVDIDGAGIGKPVKLIVGMANTHGGGTFVRTVGDADSWLTGATLTLSKGAADWLAKDIADIAQERVATVEVTHADGSKLHLSRNARSDADYAVADLARDRQHAAAFEANALAGALAQLRFDDVVPAKDAVPGEQSLKARFATFDGVVIDATLWSRDGKDYAQFKATLDAGTAEQDIAVEQAAAKADFDTQTAAAAAAKSANAKPGEAAEAPIKPLAVSDPAKDKTARLAALNSEVATLDARFDGWSFVLPAYKYAAMNKSLADFNKADAAEPDQAGTSAAPKATATPARKPAAKKKAAGG